MTTVCVQVLARIGSNWNSDTLRLEMVQLWKPLQQIFLKLNTYFPYDPMILIIYPRQIKTCSHKENSHSSFICNGQKPERTNMSGYLWMDKQNGANMHNATFLRNKKKQTTNTQDGWISKALQEVKEVWPRRLDTVWFHWHKILEKAKPSWQKVKWWLPRTGTGEGDWLGGGMRKPSGKK